MHVPGGQRLDRGENRLVMRNMAVNRLARFTKYRLQDLIKLLDRFIPPPGQALEQSLEPKLRKLEMIPRRVPGKIAIADWEIEYLDGPALAAMLRYQVLQGINDFHTPKREPYIVDCGANIGISILRYKQLYPLAQILAFEPAPEAYELLERNIKNNCLENVELVEAAVWSQSSTKQFAIQGIDGGRIAGTRSRIHGLPQTDVTAVALSNYLDREVDLLKLDIEGAELEVLNSCDGKLGTVKKLIVETHYLVDRPAFLGSILDVLDRAGFNVSIVIPESIDYAITLKAPYKPQGTCNADIYPILYAWRNDPN